MKIIKVKKKFDYKGTELRIVEREEPYMNAKEPLIMTRVIAPNNGMIPVNISRKQTLKSIIEDTIILLDDFEKRGANIKQELNKVI
ncbi:MAG: actin-related protein [Flavobacteriaceae bacterium]|jgi:actin-related protein